LAEIAGDLDRRRFGGFSATFGIRGAGWRGLLGHGPGSGRLASRLLRRDIPRKQ
jgi:hypothetical protein